MLTVTQVSESHIPLLFPPVINNNLQFNLIHSIKKEFDFDNVIFAYIFFYSEIHLCF